MKKISVGLLMLPLVANGAPAPSAEKIPHELASPHETRVDNYYWLREKKNPKVKKHLIAENNHFKAYFTPTDLKLKKKIVSEMRSKIEEDEITAPIRYAAFDYYSRMVKDKNYRIHMRKNLKTKKEEILFNENVRAKDKKFFMVLAKQFSPDLKFIAWCFDYDGSGKCEIELQNLATKKFTKTKISGVYWGDLSWTVDSKGFFYALPNDMWRPNAIWHSDLSGKTKKVFTEDDELFNLSTGISTDEKFNFAVSSSFEQTKYYYWEKNEFKPLYTTQAKVLTDIDHGDAGFIARSNHRNKNFGIYQFLNPGDEIAKWSELVAPMAQAKITHSAILKNDLLYTARSKGNDEVHQFDITAKKDHTIAFKDEVYSSSFGIVGEPQKFLIGYSSPIAPETTYEYSTKEQKLSVLKTKASPTLKPELYKTELKLVKSRDGKEIPIHMVYRKDLRQGKPQPTYLYAYGSYGITDISDFSESLFSLLDRGFIYVSAHVRGSDAEGEAWYDDGKLMNKKNTFSDFIDVADYLIRENYTSSTQLGIGGGSAGGLLVGAVINQKPENFRAAIASVPFVDALTTMLDPTLPLTTQEYLQWGNPNEKAAYDYIRSYSPYDNVQKLKYPAIYSQTGINDQQVSYWEPAKWIQKIRDHNLSKHPVILKVNMGAGHGGSSGRYARYEETAERHVFLIKELAAATETK